MCKPQKKTRNNKQENHSQKTKHNNEYKNSTRSIFLMGTHQTKDTTKREIYKKAKTLINLKFKILPSASTRWFPRKSQNKQENPPTIPF